MRRITYAILLLSFMGCKPKPQPLNVYNIKLKQLEKDLLTPNYTAIEKHDTVMVANDTAAFEQGLISYYARVKQEKLFKEKRLEGYYQTIAFSVTDGSGTDVRYKLSEKVVDSLTKNVKKIAGIN
ncbi:hypothetical protein LJ707_13270 [Mucilaginibacter sp. UR6-1]|uniref:hypothetical protein n=1 Tax=Mucilaginibacter sp. UR6-1 TaxID=1435643 RepID=UPI001E440988|nr:hypothetical protein [Mucilaginibacter sp. UR6-1]MCC8409902.1 hypothetical protein [Mucilaginibacter sp. UR6-1]